MPYTNLEIGIDCYKNCSFFKALPAVEQKLNKKVIEQYRAHNFLPTNTEGLIGSLCWVCLKEKENRSYFLKNSKKSNLTHEISQPI